MMVAIGNDIWVEDRVNHLTNLLWFDENRGWVLAAAAFPGSITRGPRRPSIPGKMD